MKTDDGALPPDPFPLVTARLLLRRFTRADREALLRYRTHPLVLRYQSVLVTAPDAAAFIAEQMARPFASPGLWTQIAITLAHTQRLIGDLGILRHAEDPQRVDIGFTIDPDCQRAGFGYEAVSTLVEHLFVCGGVSRIDAVIDVRNQASLGLARKLGMQHRERQHAVFHGEPCLEDRWVLTTPGPGGTG